MLGRNSDAAWERYGKFDPYFGVCTQDKYRTENLGESELEEFFRSGEEFINLLLSTTRERVDSSFQPTRALDFGCGVGRLTVPLAKICSDVVGTDVSDSMLDEAQNNCLRTNTITNVTLVESDDELSRVSGTFDFVLSYTVFQHIPRRRGENILKGIIDRLDTDGIGVLHFTYLRRASRARYISQWMRKYIPLANNFANLLQKMPFSYPLMQWNNYN